jgi:lactam utilization protein B
MASQLIHYSEVTAVDGTKVQIDDQTIHVLPGMPQARLICEQIRNMIGDARPLTVVEVRQPTAPVL